MAFTISQLFNAQTVDQWETTLLTTAASPPFNLSTQAWQSGGMVRTLIRLVASALAAGDQAIASIAQGGFLDFAALVTVDPSLNPGVGPGWLDVLADGGYNVQREPATFATGGITVANSGGASYTFPAGTLHIANPTSGATYSNTTFLVIGASSSQLATFAADIAGSGSSSSAGQITQLAIVLAGVTVTNPAALIGSNAESNASVVNRCRLKLQSLSPNGAAGAYAFFALTANTILQARTPPTPLLDGDITRALVVQDITSGVVTTTIANAQDGGPRGAALLPISAATNATPIRITTTGNHNLATNDTVLQTGCTGNASANGAFTVIVAGATQYDLYQLGGTSTPVAGTGAYTGGGVAECGDVGLTDDVIQRNCVPDSVTAFTQAAVDHAITFVADVWVPASQASNVTVPVQNAITAYIGALPIGGLTDPGGAYTNVVPFNEVLSVVAKAATYIQQAKLTMNGSTVDITLALTPVPEVATINSPPITVNVHAV